MKQRKWQWERDAVIIYTNKTMYNFIFLKNKAGSWEWEWEKENVKKKIKEQLEKRLREQKEWDQRERECWGNARGECDGKKLLMLSREMSQSKKNNRIITSISENHQLPHSSKQYTCTHMWLQNNQIESIFFFWKTALVAHTRTICPLSSSEDYIAEKNHNRDRKWEGTGEKTNRY